MFRGYGAWALVLAAVLAAPAAHAQIPAEGRPPTEHPWAYKHFFVWHDGGGWHLRATTEGYYHRFSGWIDSEGGIGNVLPVVPGTPLGVNWRQVQFDLAVRGAENGFDWQQAAPCVTLSLLIDGVQQPGKIAVGYYQGHPMGFAPFQVCAAEAAPAPVEPAPIVGAEPEEDPGEVAEGPEMDPAAFQPVLAPYGEWVNVPPYGLAWEPYASVVGPDFVPYTNGHWEYSDAGWLWVAAWDWGWAPFHYGSWTYVSGVWAWIPGSVWAPAWVSWRYGGGVVGWAPVGPRGVVPGDVHYTYVSEVRFGAAVNLRTHLITGPRLLECERTTRLLGGPRQAGTRWSVPVHLGPPRPVIERALGHPIVRASVVQIQRRALPPAGIRGVRYATGASTMHPFVARPGPERPAARPVRPGFARPPLERPIERPGRPEFAHPARPAAPPGRPAAEARPGLAPRAIAPPPKPKPKPIPMPPRKKKKP